MDISPHTAFSKRLGRMSDFERRSWRRSIYSETRQYIHAGAYSLPGSPPIPLSLPEIPFSQTVRGPDEITDWRKPRSCDTRVTVFEGDCFEAGIFLKSQGLNPVVLNMASASSPGGGVTNGAGAQEENLFRRSTYAHFLYNRQFAKYPIASTGAIYTPGVTVFRATEAAEYALMQVPVQLSCIALPALVHPQTHNHPQLGLWLTPQLFSLSKTKIETFLRLALSNNHDAVVLSAWGCGAYRNPPRCVATAFREVLESEEYAGRLKDVVFAIFDDHNAGKQHNPEGNVQPFAQVFGVASVRNLGPSL